MFDTLLRAGHTEGWNSWTNTFRAAQYIPAVDYVRYQRVRTRLMHEFEAALAPVDAIVNMNDLLHTNLTGHPSVIFPARFRERDGVSLPVPMVVTGHLNQDDRLLGLAQACQSRLAAHLEQPPLDRWLAEFEQGTLDPAPQEDEKEPPKSEDGGETESKGNRGGGGNGKSGGGR